MEMNLDERVRKTPIVPSPLDLDGIVKRSKRWYVVWWAAMPTVVDIPDRACRQHRDWHSLSGCLLAEVVLSSGRTQATDPAVHSAVHHLGALPGPGCVLRSGSGDVHGHNDGGSLQLGPRRSSPSSDTRPRTWVNHSRAVIPSSG